MNVGINIPAKKIVYNDIEQYVVSLLSYLYQCNLDKCLADIDFIINKYQLSKENVDGYNSLRNDFNNGDNSPLMFYTLICYSFNNQIRFNNEKKFNMSFGKNRSSFNSELRRKFCVFVNELQKKNCVFYNKSCFDLNVLKLGSNDFVYLDPPYFNSHAAYNDTDGGWSEQDEIKLLEMMDKLNENGIRFALSNNLKYGNELLDSWKDKYNVHYLNGDYSNCNYHKLDRSKDIEVLITNYEICGK